MSASGTKATALISFRLVQQKRPGLIPVAYNL